MSDEEFKRSMIDALGAIVIMSMGVTILLAIMILVDLFK